MAQRRRFLLVFSCLLAAGGACAAELGEPRVSSFRGQTLVADIELSGLDDPAALVQARVAHPDVYRGASIAVPPVLSALNLNVVRRDGRQFVHITSVRPVDTDMLHVYLELHESGRRDVRLATLWLAADPHPAPPAVAAAAVAAPGVTSPVVAAAVVTAPVVTAPVVTAPAALAVAPARKPEPAAAPAAVMTKPAVTPLALPVSTALPASIRKAHPSACTASADSAACVALDGKNAALRAKLAGLENKIRVLEAALAPARPAMPRAPAAAAPSAAAPSAGAPAAGAPAAGAPAAGAPAAAAAAAPVSAIAPPVPSAAPARLAPAPVAVLVKPKKPKPAPPAPSATPWLWIGVATTVALLAAAAIVLLLLRRRSARAAAAAALAAAAGPPVMEGVKNRLIPGTRNDAAEPVMSAGG